MAGLVWCSAADEVPGWDSEENRLHEQRTSFIMNEQSNMTAMVLLLCELGGKAAHDGGREEE